MISLPGAPAWRSELIFMVRSRRAELPLLPDSPLYSLPTVMLSPHIAGVTSPAEAAGALVENWRRLRDGLPLRGLVDRVSGY